MSEGHFQIVDLTPVLANQVAIEGKVDDIFPLKGLSQSWTRYTTSSNGRVTLVDISSSGYFDFILFSVTPSPAYVGLNVEIDGANVIGVWDSTDNLIMGPVSLIPPGEPMYFSSRLRIQVCQDSIHYGKVTLHLRRYS